METHENFFNSHRGEFNEFMVDLSFTETDDEAYIGAVVVSIFNSHLMGIVTKVHESGYADVEFFKEPQMDGCYSCSDESSAGKNHLIVIRMTEEPSCVTERKRELKSSTIL